MASRFVSAIRLPSRSESTKTWRPDIQGLRAIAVLAVVAHHADVPGLSGGYLGVDAFFVISGFLITGMLLRKTESTVGRGIASFFAGRAKRLLPASLFVLLCVTALAWLTTGPLQRISMFSDISYAALQISNWQLAADSTDYLAREADQNPVLNYWTLGVEWQSYLLLALAIAVISLAFRQREQLRLQAVFVALLLIFVVSLALSVWLTTQEPAPAFFLTRTRIWELALGGLLFMLAPVFIKRINKLDSGHIASAALGWLGIFALLFSFVFFNEFSAIPGYLALVPTLANCCVIVAGGTRHWYMENDERFQVRWVLAWSPFQYLGAWSYSWYLWHWPVLVFAAMGLGELNMATAVGVSLLSLILAIASYSFIENPFRFTFRWPRRAGIAIPIALVSIFVVSAAATAAAEIPSPRSADRGSVLAAQTAKTDRGKPYSDGCHRELDEAISEPCWYGDPTGNQTVVLWGDSHAAQWLPALDEIATQQSWKLAYFTRSSCPPTSAETFDATKSKAVCQQWNRDVIDQLKVMKPGLVLLSGYWQGYEYQTASGIQSLPQANDFAVAGLRAYLTELSKNQIPAALIVDLPASENSVPDCVALHGRAAAECEIAVTADAGFIEREAAHDLPGISVVDLLPILCPDGRCSAATIDGMVKRTDGQHLTATYAAELAAALGEQVIPLVK